MMSPKERFERSPAAKAWAEITASDAWIEAVHTAMAQMLQGATGGDFGSRMTGAREMVEVLSGLGVPSKAHELKQKPLNFKV